MDGVYIGIIRHQRRIRGIFRHRQGPIKKILHYRSDIADRSPLVKNIFKEKKKKRKIKGKLN